MQGLWLIAGWDLPFDTDTKDVDLAKDCFRILRRTCGRHYLGFRYHESGRKNCRVQFMLVFDGRPSTLGLASADFALEMRAVSVIQRGQRRKQLPIRLLYWVTYSGSEEPLRLQPRSARVAEDKYEIVVKHLEEYALAWGAWRRNGLPPPDYLEAQHSLLTNLALALAPDVST